MIDESILPTASKFSAKLHAPWRASIVWLSLNALSFFVMGVQAMLGGSFLIPGFATGFANRGILLMSIGVFGMVSVIDRLPGIRWAEKYHPMRTAFATINIVLTLYLFLHFLFWAPLNMMTPVLGELFLGACWLLIRVVVDRHIIVFYT